MPEPKMPQQEKPRKNRSFGSFLLFLTVLVAILLVVSKHSLNSPQELTQDQYWWYLYSGQIDSQRSLGANGVSGELDNGTTFRVAFADVGAIQERAQQLKAIPGYQRVDAADLAQAVESGAYTPQLVRQVTVFEEQRLRPVVNDEEGASPKGEDLKKTKRDHLYVEVWANPGALTAGALDRGLLERLPQGSGTLWLEVDGIEESPGLGAELVARGAEREAHQFDITEKKGSTWASDSSLWSSVLFVWGPWILIFAVFLIFMRQMRSQGAAGGVMSFGRSRAQLYTKESHTNITFDDVAGAEEAKDEVREVVEFLKNPGRFTRIGGRIPRGVLLVGPPGCGKTLLAKAIAGEAEVPFYSISGSDFVEMFVGVGASRVRDLFKQARENSPCIIFLDEIDAVGRRRGSGMGGGHDEREQTLNAILVEMDGFGTDEGIIVLAATNRPDVLDPALLRPGRFDREVTIDLPDVGGREEILRVHLKKVKADPEIDVSALARSTPGYSGADLAAAVNEAAIMAVLQKCDEVQAEHLEEARDKVRYGRQKKSRKLEEADRKITAFHEAGHAIVALSIPETDAPHKITIVPRGRSLGATMVVPEKESYHMQKRRLKGQLAVLFGGRASEELFCGDISAGASDDIKRATDLARAMITELGMSERIGPINYAERQGSDFLGTELLSGKWHSEQTAREIDEEVKQLLDQAFEQSREIVRKHSDEIERLTAGLLRYETLRGEEIEKIMQGVSIADLRPAPPAEPKPSARASSPTADGKVAGDELTGGLSGEAGLSPA